MNRSLFLGMSLWVASGVLSMGMLAYGADPLQFVKDVTYDPASGKLLILSREFGPLQSGQATHNARRKKIEFYLPNTALQPTPRELTVTNDPIVKSIHLEQRALSGTPAVRVEVELYTNSPYVPYTLSQDPQGLTMHFTRGAQPTTATNSLNNITTHAAPSSSETVSVSADPKPAQTPSTMSRRIELNPEPVTVSPAQPSVAPQELDPKPAEEPANSVMGNVSEEEYSIIQDIFFADEQLNIVSRHRPIAVERSFVLNDPNRYVVDLSPAVLKSKSLMRAVPHSHPNILNFKAGQLDEDTVRLVVQFKNRVLPVDLSYGQENRLLQLHF